MTERSLLQKLKICSQKSLENNKSASHRHIFQCVSLSFDKFNSNIDKNAAVCSDKTTPVFQVIELEIIVQDFQIFVIVIIIPSPPPTPPNVFFSGFSKYLITGMLVYHYLCYCCIVFGLFFPFNILLRKIKTYLSPRIQYNIWLFELNF